MIDLKYLFFVSAFIAGCSSDSNNIPNTEPFEELPTSLVTLDGTSIDSESLSCNYRQSFGASSLLELQLQYLDSPNSVAFALFISNPVPAEPYTAAAGEQGSFSFEVFLEGVRYSDELDNSEVEVLLDSLPSPDNLSNGDAVTLSGSLIIEQFSLVERFFTNEMGSRVLELNAGSVGIDCVATYQLSETIN